MARKEKKYHFIYKTTNLLSGKYYIGMHSTDNLDDGYLGSGNRLRLAIRKHGKENFIREIIEFCGTRNELKNKELEIVNLNEIAKEECMNLRVGGEGGGTKESARVTNEYMFSDENREKYSKIRSENTKKLHKLGKIPKPPNWTGKKHSDETKKLLSKIKKGTGVGQSNSQHGTCWITKDGLNKKIKKEELEQHQKEGWVKGRINK